jgi:hypothetical protein
MIEAAAEVFAVAVEVFAVDAAAAAAALNDVDLSYVDTVEESTSINQRLLVFDS